MYTKDDFIAGLRHRYEHLKLVESNYLSEPTPRKLLDLCHDIASHDLSEDDREAMAAFFGRTQSLLMAIENTRAVKMRNVLFFLNGRNQNTNRETLNLVAVMLDFKSRPLRKFQKEGFVASSVDVTAETEKDEVKRAVGYVVNKEAGQADIKEGKEVIEIDKPVKEGIEKTSSPPTRSIISKIFSGKNKYIVYALLLSVLPGTIASFHYLKEPDCMIWKGNRYMSASCDIPGAEHFNQNQFGLKEIQVKKGDVFFKDAEPVVWYCRRYGYHYFNKRGFDPVTRKPLLPITRQVLLSRNLWDE